MKLWPWMIMLVLAVPIGAYGVQISGLGNPYWSIEQDITTTSACVQSAEGATTCALFPAGDGGDHHRKVAIIELPSDATGRVRCCFAGRPGIDITARLALDPTGTSDDGPGNCFSVDASKSKTKHLSFAAMLDNGSKGAISGLCSTRQTASNEAQGIYHPCGTQTDCDDIDPGAPTTSAGTCITAATNPQPFPTFATMRQQAGLVLNCEASTGTIRALIEKEWVQL